jgi:hypothetical protein
MHVRTRSTAIGALLIALLSAGVSLGRIWLSNSTFLSSQVWAEDGLFPLCIRRDGFAECLAQPFAGYFLFVPRVLAQIVAWTPFASWPVATNLVAAALAALCGAAGFLILRNAAVRLPFAALIALLPVAAPIVGFETVNVYASSLIPLMFVMALAVSLPASRSHPWWIGVGLILTAMTVPTAVFLFLPLAALMYRGLRSRRDTMIMAAFLAAGLVVQLAIMITAPEGRELSVTWDAFLLWLESMPGAVLTVWPGLWFGQAGVLGFFSTAPSVLTPWFLLIAVVIGGTGLTIRGRGRGLTIGLLLLLGLFASAAPSLTGYPSNRYFVWPVLLWSAAGFLALDRWLAPRGRIVPWMTVVLVAALWWSAMPASGLRVTIAPPWPDQLVLLQGACAGDPGKVVDVKFSPDWPPPEENGSYTPLIKAMCFKLY